MRVAEALDTVSWAPAALQLFLFIGFHRTRNISILRSYWGWGAVADAGFGIADLIKHSWGSAAFCLTMALFCLSQWWRYRKRRDPVPKGYGYKSLAALQDVVQRYRESGGAIPEPEAQAS